MPDFNKMASRFDDYLPQIRPVGLAVLDRLGALPGGATVLDVACGTGEPGLTLLRRMPGIHLLGVDSAPAAIDVARAKAAREALENVRFDVMSSDALALPDESVDAVISRFGLLMFGDVRASAREVSRVLRRGGSFSFAVWDDMTRNTLVHAMVRAVRARLPREHESLLDRLKELSAEGFRARLLEEAGIGAVSTEMFTWEYVFDDFDGPWDLLSRMGAMTGQSLLSAEAEREVKAELVESLSPYRQGSGGYRIPHTCRLFWGER